MMTVVRTQAEINDVLDKAGEGFDNGSFYPGMSYEQGIIAFADWLFGNTDEAPFD